MHFLIDFRCDGFQGMPFLSLKNVPFNRHNLTVITCLTSYRYASIYTLRYFVSYVKNTACT